MAFVRLIATSQNLQSYKITLVEEKLDAIKYAESPHRPFKFAHIEIVIRSKLKRLWRRIGYCCCCRRFCFNLKHSGSVQNYVLKSVIGFFGGLILTYIFFMFLIFQLSFSFTTATITCSILGCILVNGLAFSPRIRCIVLLTLPHFFSERGRQMLVAYALILVVSGPAKNTLNNLGILSESLACGQEQLKNIVRQIIEVIKKPFYALKDAIKKVIETIKVIIKKIKELLIKIKRIVMAIVRVIKAAFMFIAKIINICNKELGTPFERCSRVFDNAIADCNAKLGSMFSWMCSITYIVKSVCYLVKIFDFVCMIVDFIKDSVVGVVIRKIKAFVRHIRTMFYVRIRFAHSFHFETKASKSITEISKEILQEIKDRTRTMVAVFKFVTSTASLFFIFMIVKVILYRYKFLTQDSFDNKFITNDFLKIDMRRAKINRETVLPLNSREQKIYVKIKSSKLTDVEKKKLKKAVMTLVTINMKAALYMGIDYFLYWILNLVSRYGRFQSKVQAPNIPTPHISGTGILANLLKSIVKAFQPMGLQLEIDTVPCLPTPIPPDLDRYIQIATLLILCWVLTLLEPYGLRLRTFIMCYYHPLRGRQRAIWLYNNILRKRTSFLKFARRQLRRNVLGNKNIEKVTLKEFLAANFKCFAICFDKNQTACLLCGKVFRENDAEKPIKCQTPDCPGLYCEECFADLRNLCTVCLSPIEYGDLSDLSEEKDSSEDQIRPKKTKNKKRCLLKLCSKRTTPLSTGDVADSTEEGYSSFEEKKARKRINICSKLLFGKLKRKNFLRKSEVVTQEDKNALYSSEEEESRQTKKKDKSLFDICSKGSHRKKVKSRFFSKLCSWKRKSKAEIAENDISLDLLSNEYSEHLYSIEQTTYEEEEEDVNNKEEDKKMLELFETPSTSTETDASTTLSSTDYSYSYQYEKDEQNIDTLEIPFKDVEEQTIHDYASMESFRDESAEELIKSATFEDHKDNIRTYTGTEHFRDEDTEELIKSTILDQDDRKEAGTNTYPERIDIGTVISGETIANSKQNERIKFISVDQIDERKRRKKRKKKLKYDNLSCTCSDSERSSCARKPKVDSLRDEDTEEPIRSTIFDKDDREKTTSSRRPERIDIGTAVSGETIAKSKQNEHIKFIGAKQADKGKRKLKRKKKLKYERLSCSCSDSEESSCVETPKSTTGTSKRLGTSSETVST